MKVLISAMLGLGLGLGAAAVPAAAQGVAEFRVGGVAIDVPLPSGFCTPAGKGADVAQFIAAADADNVTDLSLFPCADQTGDAPDYYLVKTPKTLLMNDQPRAPLLESLRAEFDKPEYKQALQGDANGKASAAYSDLMRQKAEITGGVTPMGLDETCAYIGGVLKFESGTISYTRAVSGCISSVGNRVVMVYRYSAGELANVLKMMKASKALVQAMRVKPAK